MHCQENTGIYKMKQCLSDDVSQLNTEDIQAFCEYIYMSWPENQGILFFYISKTLEMIQISFMASLLNAVL